jgi:site-specific DNA recombinase
MPKRYVIGTRVSTRDQSDNGTSLQSQEEACVKYVERLGGTVVATISEDVSGIVPLADRPRQKRILEMLKNGDADGVVWYMVDRFFRDDLEARLQCRQWLRAGLELHFADTGRVKNESDIVFLLRAWQAGDEREKISERTSRGRYTKARNGKVVGACKPLYGYSYIDGAYHICEEEAKVVKSIYMWYVYGDESEKPMTMHAIARKLTCMNVPPPGLRWKGRVRVRPTHVWGSTAVRRLLLESAYMGIWRYARRIGKGGKGGFRPLDESIPVSIPIIIEEELWNAAQARRLFNQQMSPRNAKFNYLLRGLVKCGVCKCSMTGSNGGDPKRTATYRCGRKTKHYANLEPQGCDNRSAPARRLEDLTWEFIQGVMLDASKFEQLLREAQSSERAMLQPRQDRLETVLDSIARNEKDAKELVVSIRRVPPGGVVEAALQHDIDRVEQEASDLRKERDQLMAMLSKTALTDEEINTALQFREDTISGLRHPTNDDKRSMLELLRVQIEVLYTQAKVACRIPVSKSIDLKTTGNAVRR